MRRRVTVEVLDSIFVLHGWQAHKLALEAGLRPTYSGVHQGWMADTRRLSTFEAYCAHRNVPLEIEGLNSGYGGSQSETVQRVADLPTAVDSSDTPLFDLGGR